MDQWDTRELLSSPVVNFAGGSKRIASDARSQITDQVGVQDPLENASDGTVKGLDP